MMVRRGMVKMILAKSLQICKTLLELQSGLHLPLFLQVQCQELHNLLQKCSDQICLRMEKTRRRSLESQEQDLLSSCHQEADRYCVKIMVITRSVFSYPLGSVHVYISRF